MKNSVITGASRGLGLALVKEFLASGHHVFAVTREAEKLKDLQNENLTIIEADINHIEGIELIVKTIRARVKHIDILINNAGVLLVKGPEEVSFSDLQHVYNANVFAPYILSTALLPFLGGTESSHIVNIGSMGGVQGSVKFKGLSVYSSSKAALAGITECLAVEFEGRNIRVNCLALGAVKTEMLKGAFPDFTGGTDVLEMARYVAGFACEAHKVMNGKVIPVSDSTP